MTVLMLMLWIISGLIPLMGAWVGGEMTKIYEVFYSIAARRPYLYFSAYILIHV